MKKKKQYECIECGYQSPISYGKCPQCDNWGSMVESRLTKGELGKGDDRPPVKPVSLNEIDDLVIRRDVTGFEE